jgi:hypothetical protein
MIGEQKKIRANLSDIQPKYSKRFRIRTIENKTKGEDDAQNYPIFVVRKESGRRRHVLFIRV